MSANNKKPAYPFMVFRESFRLPDGRDPFTVLNDPNASPDEKEKIRQRFNDDVEIARSTVDRDSQRARHRINHARRAKVLADLQLGANDRPRRGEPKRLARKHGIALATVQGWIEQWDKERRRVPSKGLPNDWRTVTYGRLLRRWYRLSKKG